MCGRVFVCVCICAYMNIKYIESKLVMQSFMISPPIFFLVHCSLFISLLLKGKLCFMVSEPYFI